MKQIVTSGWDYPPSARSTSASVFGATIIVVARFAGPLRRCEFILGCRVADFDKPDAPVPAAAREHVDERERAASLSSLNLPPSFQ